MAKKTAERKIAEKIAAEKGIKVKSVMRYLQRSKATGNKQKIKNPKFAGISDKIAKKAKSFVKKEKKKSEAAKAPAKKQSVDRSAARRESPVNDNPLSRSNKSGRSRVTVDADFEYFGGDRRVSLYLTADETEDITNAESLEDALDIWLTSKDSFLPPDFEIKDFRSIKIQ